MTRHNVWNAAHGPAHVAAHASGREYAPRRAAVRAALSVLLLVLVLLSSPTDAFAASNPSVVYSDDGLYVVAPCNNGFDAALATIGLFSVRPRLTAEMRTKLSNASTGGAFYELAARFQQQNNTLEGFGNAVYIGILTYNVATYGAGNIMQATGVTAADIANAKRDFNIIQNGGSLGGGGGGSGGGPTGDATSTLPRSFTCYPSPYTSEHLTETTSYWFMVGGSKVYSADVTNVVLSVTTTVQDLQSQFDIYVVVRMTNSTAQSSNVDIYFLPVGSCQLEVVNGFLRLVNTSGNSFIYLRNRTSDTDVAFSGSGTLTGSINLTRSSTASMSASGSISFESSNVPYYVSGYSPTGGGSGNLTDNWPHDVITGHPIDEPAVPTPPVFNPITYTNPTDDPLPTPPPETPVTPVNPIVTTDPTNTTPQDYTPWLSAILNELRNFHRDAVGLGNNVIDALATHCTHITTTIMDETEWLYDQLKAQIRAGVQAILNGLDQNCTEMMNYLEDLAQWLADQLQFTFNIDNSYNPEISVPAYDDGSVIAWLQRIYNAIRNIKGPTIGTPVTEKDVEDGFDWWAWILSLLDQLFDNVISQTVGEIESFLEEFRNLFPLSIPWDVVAILTMWAGTPTTPQVEFTLFEDVAYLPEVTYEIDMTPFNATAATIRDAEKIVFAFYLLFKTQWLLDTLKSATDAAGEFIEGVIT